MRKGTHTLIVYCKSMSVTYFRGGFISFATFRDFIHFRGMETTSPKNKTSTGWGGFEPVNRTVMDAFNHASYFPKEPEIGFGTGSRYYFEFNIMLSF